MNKTCRISSCRNVKDITINIKDITVDRLNNAKSSAIDELNNGSVAKSIRSLHYDLMAMGCDANYVSRLLYGAILSGKYDAKFIDNVEMG